MTEQLYFNNTNEHKYLIVQRHARAFSSGRLNALRLDSIFFVN